MRLVSQFQPSKRLAPGDRVDDHLVIQSVLGKGGTAIVFEALHTRLSSLVALKVVEVDAAYARDAAARLAREAQVCAAIDDPHIPKIYDVGQLDDGTPYIVMEKIAGETLEHMLEEGALRPQIAVRIVRDLLSALTAVHAAFVVHRDIKPANLIVQTAEDGTLRIRLMDFGVSKEISSMRSDPAITHEGALVGTPHYMSPEQICDDAVDGRADVYAAGVLLYELLAGEVPFDGGSSAEVMSAVLRHEYTELTLRCKTISSALSELVDRAMAARPEDRFQSARAMRDALDRVISAMDAQESVRAQPGGMALKNVASWTAVSISLAFLLAIGSRQTQEDRIAQAPLQARSEAPDETRMLEQSTVSSLNAQPPVPEGLPTAMATKAELRRLPLKRVAPVRPTLRQRETSAAERESVEAAPLPVSQGMLVSDYVKQLEELGRVVSDVAADLEPHDSLPDNPYR